MNTQNKTKRCIAKYFTKNSRGYDSNPSPVKVPHINSSHVFTMLLSSELYEIRQSYNVIFTLVSLLSKPSM